MYKCWKNVRHKYPKNVDSDLFLRCKEGVWVIIVSSLYIPIILKFFQRGKLSPLSKHTHKIPGYGTRYQAHWLKKNALVQFCKHNVI